MATLAFAFPIALPGCGDVAAVIYLGVVQIGLAYLCLSAAIRKVSAFEATTVLLLEPVLNPIWTWLAFGEFPGAMPLLGGAIILCATLFNAFHQSRTGKTV